MADYPLSYTGQQIDTALGKVINNQLVETTRTVNGKALSSNISLTNTDVGAASSGTTINGTSLGTSAQPITLTGANINVSGSDSTKINTALAAKVPNTRTVNTKPLSEDITVGAVDIPYTTTLISTITTVKGALDAALGGISKIYFADEDRNIDYNLSIEDGYFYINLVS